MKIEHVNPEGLHSNPAFTQLVSVEGAVVGLADPRFLVEIEAVAALAA